MTTKSVAKPNRGQLTDEDKQYIRDNHKTIPYTVMARKLHRLAKNVGDFMDAEGLQRFVTSGPPPGHAWRRANEGLRHQLDAMRTHNRITHIGHGAKK